MLKITIVAMGHKMPRWVLDATDDYLKRLTDGISVSIIEIPLLKRNKGTSLHKILDQEHLLMQSKIPQHARVIALDKSGNMPSSEGLADKIKHLMSCSSHLCYLIGGPEGIHPTLLEQCHERWSLSALTFPHTIARIVVIETLYRAWSILNNHPYHK